MPLIQNHWKSDRRNNQLVIFVPILQISTQQVSVNRRRGVCTRASFPVQPDNFCTQGNLASNMFWARIRAAGRSHPSAQPWVVWGVRPRHQVSHLNTYLPITPLDRYSYVFHEMNNSNTMRSSMNSYLPITPHLYS